jgi:hypothetical protein
MPAPREDVGAVSLDGKIYVLGGTAHEDAQIRRNEVYDPAANTWSSRAPMPRGSHHLAVALAQRENLRIRRLYGSGTQRPCRLRIRIRSSKRFVEDASQSSEPAFRGGA